MTFEERVANVSARGYSERQARFLVTVMLHSGVCTVRQYCDFAGIVRGQKSQDFFATLVERRHASTTTDVHGKTRIFHVYGRGLYESIGEPNNRNRKPAAIGSAIEKLLILDAVIGSRELDWLATERDKVAHFARLFGTSVRKEELPHLTFGTPPGVTVRYFPDKLPIGIAEDGRPLFTYLIKRASPVEFRSFLQRHAELLRALPSWRLRILTPTHLSGATRSHRAAVNQELLSPLRLSVVEELRWFFEASNRMQHVALADSERFLRAKRAFSTPAYRALYGRWLEQGEKALTAVSSSTLADAVTRGAGEVECRVLADPYSRFRSFVGTA